MTVMAGLDLAICMLREVDYFALLPWSAKVI
jgi:hypothetical protein